MAAPLSTVLRSINRDKNSPLNILYSNNHEGYSATLAKTGHNFYILTHLRKIWQQKCCVHMVGDLFFLLFHRPNLAKAVCAPFAIKDN